MVISMNPFEYHEDDRHLAYVEYDPIDRFEIFLGYSDAVFILIEEVISGKGTEDELIYPIVFSARHSIEFGLKIIYEGINKLKKIKMLKTDYQISFHSISDIEKVMQSAVKIDKRIEEEFDKIIPYLKDFYFDENEEAFRYKLSKGGKNILEENNITRISIDVLCCKYNYFQNRMKNLYHLIEELIEEYKLKTYTGSLSRAQILALAKDLNGFEDVEPDKKEKMKTIAKSKYNVSKNQIDQAIKLIRKYPEFSIIMGKERKVCEIKDSEIQAYVDLVYKIGEKPEKGFEIINLGEIDTKLLKEIKYKNEIIKEFVHKIEESTLLYFKIFMLYGKGEMKYTEYFYDNLEYLKQSLSCDKYYRIELIKKISTYLNCGYVLKGMNIFGQKTYANILYEKIKEYNIRDSEIIPGCIDLEDI